MKPGTIGVAVLVLAAATAAGQSLDEILAKNLKARGGAARVKGIRSGRMTGTLSMGAGMQADLVFEFQKPGKVRQEFTVQGVTGVTAYDGSTGWQVMPFGGTSDPEPLSPEDLKEIVEQAENLDGDLVDWKAKGSRVELIGREAADGTDAWKLRITLKSGTEKTVWLDATTFLEIRGESRRHVEGKVIEIVTKLGDYREVSGVKVPFVIQSRPKGASDGQTAVFRSVELDVPVDPARFRRPAAAPSATPSPKPRAGAAG